MYMIKSVNSDNHFEDYTLNTSVGHNEDARDSILVADACKYRKTHTNNSQ